ncbi:hypothetical protein GCM10011316_26960 [Roseibium aquae]|uniref:ABC-type amino acid transport substrate-binding protein n=1 Tax=Roseibium aquae TaxID=1323746 RepID=A0A916X1F9_9HYPH|nr:hypothetical protein [Roseibium aquae]GGB53543.1 hypothetical protein GCM10011316_26960 [Roseibium aquae]
MPLKSAMLKCAVVLAMLYIGSWSANAQAVTSVRLGLLSAGVEVYSYEISVLKLALAHADGDYDLTIETLDIPQERALVELEAGRASFNLFFTGFNADREDRFRQIDIPLSRGLLGHRVFVTSKDQLQVFAAARTLEDLRSRLVVASGIGWPDTDIFKAAGFSVVTDDYEILWNLAGAKRVNAINRGVHEAFVEIRERERTFPDLVVDPHVMVRYPFDYLFYLRKEDEQLARAIETGLLRAYETGAFMNNFRSHPMIQAVIGAAQPSARRLFEIDNPFMSDRQRAIPEVYWHRF